MSKYQAVIQWSLGDGDFKARTYSRRHQWAFDGGVKVRASSSPAVVPLPYSDEAAVDPEEAFVASLASCHMLWFLDLASRAGIEVTHYEDDAVGTMARNEAGKMAITHVLLQPKIQCKGTIPDAQAIERLHHRAHENCFIANSVHTVIEIQSRT